MSIHLIVPAPFSAISGGYNYDRRMVEGLRALGQDVRVVEMAGRHPYPDDAATAAAQAALAEIPADARIIIDGLGLPAFLPLADELKRRAAFALIHHPTALEPGAPTSQREALRPGLYPVPLRAWLWRAGLRHSQRWSAGAAQGA